MARSSKPQLNETWHSILEYDYHIVQQATPAPAIHRTRAVDRLPVEVLAMIFAQLVACPPAKSNTCRYPHLAQDFQLGDIPNLTYLVLDGCLASFNTTTNPTPFDNLWKLDLEHIHALGTKFLASLGVLHKLVDLKLYSIALEWDAACGGVSVTLPQLQTMEVDSCEDAGVIELLNHLCAPSMSNFHFRRGVEDGRTDDLAPFHSFCGLSPCRAMLPMT
ncbi:hypothetical protein PLEOSDRAFT_1099696 [Pleurotus ostreatus PC15]|uniref:Uncharacterized protein n=1 Tax=Pleurotus ostreatus (strain PC15) TaxID=1137138 RepID=A0A067PCY2_PLEO1|nr:hypothetical protein PLEOSDRAFT_1099696 [Pleurotus ostreatus PC15]